jgi:LPS export ABC transporter permease LptF/LPS export ABC transporter permease LptG
MFRLERYILQETLAPTGLGLFLFLTVLLVHWFFKLAKLVVEHGISLLDVGKLVLCILPSLLTMTIPMALLLGILIGLSRLAADSEMVALSTCGVSPRRILLPVVLLGVLGAGVSYWIYDQLVPEGNRRHTDLILKIRRESDLGKEIQPRIFNETFPNVVLYADNVTEEGALLERVFLHRDALTASSGPSAATMRPAVDFFAARARIEQDPDGTIRFLLEDGTQHSLSPTDPGSYERAQFHTYVLTVDPEAGSGPRGGPDRSLGPREMSVRQLREAAGRLGEAPTRGRARTARTYRVEVQKRFALPLACVAFALIGFPLASGSRRGGRGSAFALCIGIILFYYAVISFGEDMAIQGRLSPVLGAWLPNLALSAAGLVLLVLLERRRLPRLRLRAAGRALLGRMLDYLPSRPERSARSSPAKRRWPGILDRYVLRTYLQALFFVFTGLYVVYVLGDYFLSRAKKVVANDVPWPVVLEYYEHLTPQVIQYVLPLGAMVAALVAFGLLARGNETVAMTVCGVSLYRAVLPILAIGVLLSAFSYLLHDYVLPYTNRRVEELEDRIDGRSPRSYYRPGRKWVMGEDGRLFNFLRFDRVRRGLQAAPHVGEGEARLQGLAVYELGPAFELRSRLHASSARWDGTGWVMKRGWTRTFGEASAYGFESFVERRAPFRDGPDLFSNVRTTPDEMRFGEYRRYIAELRKRGYDTRGMPMELYRKLSFPSVTFVLLVIGIPFAFRAGRHGALYGVGTAIALGMVYYTVLAFFEALGRAELLLPLVAAFAPNVLFLTLGAYLILHLRT